MYLNIHSMPFIDDIGQLPNLRNTNTADFITSSRSSQSCCMRQSNKGFLTHNQCLHLMPLQHNPAFGRLNVSYISFIVFIWKRLTGDIIQNIFIFFLMFPKIIQYLNIITRRCLILLVDCLNLAPSFSIALIHRIGFIQAT